MDDAMPDAEHARAAVLRAQPARRGRRAPRVRRDRRVERSVGELLALAVLGGERGEVPMPSICPRAASASSARRAAGRRRTSGSMSRR